MADVSPKLSGSPQWGVVGSNRWETLRFDRSIDREGVVRRVERGVDYVLESRELSAVKPPFPRWRKRPQDSTTYELDLGGTEGTTYHSLAELRDILQGKNWRGGERALAELDGVAIGLLRTIAALHKQGFGAGLLQPANVIYSRPIQGSDPAVMLPDFGFVRLRGVLPEWMRPDVPFAKLWERTPEAMNERCFDRLRYPQLASRFAETADRVEGAGLDPQADLGTVARLFAWVLAPDGLVRFAIPSPDSAPWSKAEVWAVLLKATQRGFRDANEFADALSDEPARPSRHFIEQIKPTPLPQRPRWVYPVLVTSALAAVIAGVALWGVGPPPPPPPFCEECPPASKLYGPLFEFARASEAKDLTAELIALDTINDPSIATERYRIQEDQCRSKVRAIALADLIAAYQDLPEQAASTVVPIDELMRRVAEFKARGIKVTASEGDASPPADPRVTELLEQAVAGLGRRAETVRKDAYVNMLRPSVVAKQAQQLRKAYEDLSASALDRTPKPEEYPPWLKKLLGPHR